MKIALITDTHWGARNDSPVFAEYFNRFYNEIFFPYLEEHGIKRIIHLGDVVDRRKYINFITARHLNNFVNTCISKEIQLDVIVGNHDTSYKNTNEFNSMNELFASAPKQWFRYYSDPAEIEVGGVKIAMLPWICSGNYQQSMDFIRDTDAKILFGHLEIQGFQMYRGTVVDHGFDQELFSKFKVVCSGHFHHKSSKDNIHYLGSPYEITWSDFNDERGFHIFDTDTNTLKYVVNPLYMFRKMYYDDRNTTLDALFEEIDFLGVDLKHNYVKLFVRHKTNSLWFDQYIDKLERVGLSDLQIIEEALQIDSANDYTLEEQQDTYTILSRVIDGLDTDVDKTKLLSLMRSLYDESLSLE